MFNETAAKRIYTPFWFVAPQREKLFNYLGFPPSVRTDRAFPQLHRQPSKASRLPVHASSARGSALFHKATNCYWQSIFFHEQNVAKVTTIVFCNMRRDTLTKN